MISSFDPTQETLEEYLRRYHLKDNLNMEWKNDQTKKANLAADDDTRSDDGRGYSKP